MPGLRVRARLKELRPRIYTTFYHKPTCFQQECPSGARAHIREATGTQHIDIDDDNNNEKKQTLFRDLGIEV